MPDLVPVRQSVREINDNLWIIGDVLLLSHTTVRPSSGCFWSDGSNAFYTLVEKDISEYKTRPLRSTSSLIQLVHDAGDVNAAWRIGEAFLKVHEHITLDYLHDPVNGSIPTFPIPRVLYHREHDNRYYLITSRLPGDTLEDSWPSMNDTTKQECIEQAVNICKELAQRRNNKICGVDGGNLSESWMKPPGATDGYSHETLLSYCRDLNMTCDTFALYHGDMGPRNIIVDLTAGCTLGLIDWEVAGYVPHEWIRTKFSVCWAMDLTEVGVMYRGRRAQKRLDSAMLDLAKLDFAMLNLVMLVLARLELAMLNLAILGLMIRGILELTMSKFNAAEFECCNVR